MTLLLDTHVVIWWIANDPNLTLDARQAIADSPAVFVSAVSTWEIEIKRHIGKLTAPEDLEYQLERHAFQALNVTWSHGIAASRLPLHHRDPFDRLLIGQALTEGLTIVTRDNRFAIYNVPTLRA